jgi:hypothetical protein
VTGKTNAAAAKLRISRSTNRLVKPSNPQVGR